MMSSYLQQLTVRLATGIGMLDDEFRVRHIEYLHSCQNSDGGFGGRMGGSDLYYTAFALRGLSVLGELYGPVAEKAARFLQTQVTRKQSIVDFFSLFYAGQLLRASAGIDIFSAYHRDWPDQVANFLESLRRDDGGYAKAIEGHAGSTYHTFLVALVYELIERDMPAPHRVMEFLNTRRAKDGGWHEIRASKRPGTNPTAAAAATVRILGEFPTEHREQTIDFLCEMQTDEGGLRANSRIPIADLLSSFTGGLTLLDLDAFDELDRQALKRFVDSLERSGGGFQAAAWDEAHDVEYTFYGIGCKAILAEASNRVDNL